MQPITAIARRGLRTVSELKSLQVPRRGLKRSAFLASASALAMAAAASLYKDDFLERGVQGPRTAGLLRQLTARCVSHTFGCIGKRADPTMPIRTRKVIVYVAVSADGFIARPDGGVDWLDRPRTAGDYGWAEFYRSIDTVLWGRKTYDMALDFQRRGIKGAEFPRTKRNYAFSHQPPTTIAPGVEFVTEPLPSFVQRLRAAPGKDIWVMGGAGLIGSLLDANEIDEFIIHVIPTFIGEGIPLIAARHRTAPLRLRSTGRYADGVVRLHYAVIKSGAENTRGRQRRPANARQTSPRKTRHD